MAPTSVSRILEITSRYAGRRIALIGDFCLDRYLEIDPGKQETSIETGLPVHNVVNVRAQPGGAGTILNNLVALGVGNILPVTWAGRDGEGFELRRALRRLPGVTLNHFLQTSTRRTFTYTKPLLLQPGKVPRELNRIDIKNWSPTPKKLRSRLIHALRELACEVDAMILLDQVDLPETGVITRDLLHEIREITLQHPQLLVLADSRRSLRDYPPVSLKMNRPELAALTGTRPDLPLETVQATAAALATRQGRPVFITLAENGIIGASPNGEVTAAPIHAVRGEIDIVGAGDAVTANLAAALAGGATVAEAVLLANAAASIVIHQLGTTGTATVDQIVSLLGAASSTTPGGRQP